MNFKEHDINGIRIVEVVADDVLIQKADDGVDLIGNFYFQGYDRVIIYVKDITSDFFDLKNGMAGEILQKFSNYRIRLAIVGDFSMHASKSLADFIRESNSLGHFSFVETTKEALEVLSNGR